MRQAITRLRERSGARGFTLVETLVAVLLLVAAIAGPLTIAARGLSAAVVAKDQIVAFYLAQDAVEYARAKRDTACLTAGYPCAGAWLGSGAGSLAGSCTGAAGCQLDSTDNSAITPCISSGNICAILNYDNTNKRFTYSATSGTSIVPTIYRRTVKLTTPIGGNANEAKLTVIVEWANNGGIAHSITVEENLFNWQ